ncbi:hypothetical protein Aduo_009667 [Ancylostoma duodenale]
MQNKLSSSLLMQIFVHLFALASADVVDPVITLVSNTFGISGKAITVIELVYIVIANMLFIWYPVAIGAIIKWSISGLLTNSDSDVGVKEFTFVRSSTAEKHTSRKIVKF